MTGAAPAIACYLYCGIAFNMAANLDDEQALMESLRNGHRASIQSIRSLSCRIRNDNEPVNGIPPAIGEYFRSGDLVRINMQNGDASSESVVDGSTITNLERTPKDSDSRHRIIASRLATRGVINRCDAWAASLFSFCGPATAQLSLDQLLGVPPKRLRLKRQTANDGDVAYLDMSFLEDDKSELRLEIWFDSKVNWLARKIRRHTENAGYKIRSEIEIARFVEPAPAIFFPEESKSRIYSNDQLLGSGTVKFTDIKINQLLPSDTFKLRFPPGTSLADKVEGKMFKIDAEGKILEEDTKHPLVQTPGLPLAPQYPTEEEPKSSLRWLLPAALGTLMLAACLWLIGRRKRRS
jgi:hypothetical protein